MAKYEKDRKFYWLQLKEDFFEEDSIDWLEEQQNGILYSHFYLKLCLKSLGTNGVLVRRVGDVLVPYNAKKLSEITRTEIDTVIVAMELLKKIGLVKILESGEIYMTQIQNMIGSQSIGAFKKQQQRQLKKESENKLQIEGGGQMSPKCPPEIEIDIDKDKEIEIDIDKDKEIEIDIDNSCQSSINFSNEEVFKHFEKCGFILSPLLLEKISSDIKIYGYKNLMDAATEAMERGKYNNYKYVIGIAQNWQTEGRKGNTDGTTRKSKKDNGTKEQGPQYNFDFS